MAESKIAQYLNKILEAVYGKDVRQSIHDAIWQCYEDGKVGAVDLVAREQIANLVANNDPTEGNSELVDIRVDDRGHIYESAGENVRSIGSVRSFQNILSNIEWIDGYFVDGRTGRLSSSSSWSVAHMIPIYGNYIMLNGKIRSTAEPHRNLNCYGGDLGYIGGISLETKNFDLEKIKLFENTRYVSLSTYTAEKDGVELYIIPGDTASIFYDNYVSSYQYIIGAINIEFQSETVLIDVPTTIYFSKFENGGTDYTIITVPKTSFSQQLPTTGGGWKVIYYEKNDNEGTFHVESFSPTVRNWLSMFGPNMFVVGVFYNNNPTYKPHTSGSYIVNGNEYAPIPAIRSLESALLDKFDKTYNGSVAYIASGSFSIDTVAKTIQINTRMLCSSHHYNYIWLYEQDAPIKLICDDLTPMLILAVDRLQNTLNLYDTNSFNELGVNGYYVASYYQGRFYDPHILPDIHVKVNNVDYLAGELFYEENVSTYVEKKYRDYIENVITDPSYDNDNLGDIVTPSHWDCMEGREFSMFFDCLSRNDDRMNLYRIINSKSLTRNEYCLNYTPASDDTTFNVTVSRLNANTMETVESKVVEVRVHHPLSSRLTRNICICGDSLVDNGYVAKEVYRLLTEDDDCTVTQIGTRGSSDGKHEGRGSWRWQDYLSGSEWAGKTNAFWSSQEGRLNFQEYCSNNGFSGIDYFLIALGTNDVSQGSTLYRTEEEVKKFVDYAKQFVDALLSSETGFPNCKIGIGLPGPGADYSYLVNSSMGIFRKSINTLNLAMIKAFDEGAYKANVTCFAHGLRTDRKHAFPYSDKATNNRFEETSRTLTNSIHPSERGYKAWADGYYCQIRAWLEEDSN